MYKRQDLNRTKIPMPLLVRRPAIREPKVMEEARYSFVITIDEAQLGIKPIRLRMIGPRILLSSNMVFKYVSKP